MPGSQEFAHDIFISYRHNDNKPPGGIGEGWVTEFVNYLTTELQTMVKGNVSIYFDNNPRDGLKEHHHVEGSLTERLKSTIFIPILSQTYCDQESYAWNNEFLPFLELSANDSLGLSVKLQNGNVTGRVLPVCIHDLEHNDLQLLESQLKGKLRAINFVFKSPGVNRPLRAIEEDPLKNANRTLYRDQINKVANAIREILESVKAPKMIVGEAAEPRKNNSLLDGLISTKSTIKSIAVLPLVFKSENPNDEFLSQGFAEDLFASMKHIRALRLSIHGLSTVAENGSQNMPVPPSMMMLTGNMTISDKTANVEVQLIQSKTRNIVWHATYECDRHKLFTLRPLIISQICETLSLTLNDNERTSIQHEAEASATALELFWKGRYHWRKRGNDLLTSQDCFEQASYLAPGFADAYAGIANATVLLGYYGMIPFQESITKCKEAALKALSIDPTLIDAYYPLAYVSLCQEIAWTEAEHTFSKVFGINPTSTNANLKFNNCLTQITCNFEENKDEPIGNIPHFLHAYSLLHKGRFEEGLKVAQMAIGKDGNSFMAHRAAGLCFLGLGYESEAIEALNMAAQLSNRHPWILLELIGTYSVMANNTEAQSIMEEAMDRVNSLPARINDYFFQ